MCPLSGIVSCTGSAHRVEMFDKHNDNKILARIVRWKFSIHFDVKRHIKRYSILFSQFLLAHLVKVYFKEGLGSISLGGDLATRRHPKSN